MDDAGPGRHDPEAAERRLGPAEQLVALAIALVLALDVEREGARRPEGVDLDRVVDDQVGRDERVDPGRVAAEVGHRVAHDREVDDGRDAGQVLEDHPGGHERQLRFARTAGAPCREGLDIGRADDASTGLPEDVLEQDLDRDRGGRQVEPVGQRREPPDVGQPGTERSSGIERVGRGHGSSFRRGGRYTRRVESYRAPGPRAGTA